MIKRIKTIMLIMCIIVIGLQIKSQANVVEYKGGAEGLIITPDDFFLNIGELLPGDIEEDVAYIKNSTKDSIEVFFKTEPLEQEEYYDEIDYSLLEKIKLKISLKQTSNSEEKLLYEGNLGAELMSEYISLGEYKKGYDGEFIFKIEVPTELRNNYTLSTTKVKWVFAVEKKDGKNENNTNINTNTNTNTNTNNNANNSNKTNDKNEIKENTKNPIKEIIETVTTGDNIYYAVTILLIAIVIAISIVTVIIKKKSNKKSN